MNPSRGTDAWATSRASPVGVPARCDAWLAELTRVRVDSARASVESASGLEGTTPAVALAASNVGGNAKGPVDVDLPPWSKGRDGTAVGRAVHAVLQSVDLASGVDAAVAAQCVAEGVERHSAVVTGLVRSALASPPCSGPSRAATGARPTPPPPAPTAPWSRAMST